MYDSDTNATLYKMVTEDELHEVLKSFKGYKSLGLDRWPLQLFIHFFDLFKSDLLDMVEDSRVTGSTHQHIISTYIALILKQCPSTHFSDYRPISLCNLIYKFI